MCATHLINFIRLKLLINLICSHCYNHKKIWFIKATLHKINLRILKLNLNIGYMRNLIYYYNFQFFLFSLKNMVMASPHLGSSKSQNGAKRSSTFSTENWGLTTAPSATRERRGWSILRIRMDTQQWFLNNLINKPTFSLFDASPSDPGVLYPSLLQYCRRLKLQSQLSYISSNRPDSCPKVNHSAFKNDMLLDSKHVLFLDREVHFWTRSVLAKGPQYGIYQKKDQKIE